MASFSDIQSGGAGNAGSGQASIARALTGVLAGSLIMVWVKHEGAAVTITVSDGTSSLTPATKRSNGSNTHGQWFYLLASVASGTVTYTASFSGAGGDFPSIQVYEKGYSGGAPVFDKENGATGNSTSLATGAVATTGDVSICGVGYAEFTAGSPTAEQINGLAAEVITDNDLGINDTASWTRKFTTKINGQGTATVPAAEWAAAIIAFKIPDVLFGQSGSTLGTTDDDDDASDDFLVDVRAWFGPELSVANWFDEDLSDPAAAAGNDISAIGTLSITGAADLDAAGSLLAAGTLSIIGVADLDATGALVAVGALSITGVADLDAQGTLLAVGALSITGAADLDAPGSLVAVGSLVITGAADLDAIGQLLAAGSIFITGAADLTTGGFPTQFFGLRTFYNAAVRELSLVALADAPPGMGGRLTINKNGTLYAVYLVETTDPNASSVRFRTSTGTKAVRLKT